MMGLLAAFILGAVTANAQFRAVETGGGAERVSLQAPASIPANLTWTLPDADGAANQCFATNGSATMIWRNLAAAANSMNANDGAPINAVYVNAAGSVGIGTTSPTAGVILDVNGTGTAGSALIIPRGTTANRPTTGVNGMIRYNTTTNRLEGYQGGAWVNLSSGLVGKSTWAGNGGCLWMSASGTSFANIPADGSCLAPTVTGGVTAPGTRIPGVVLNNLPPGDYEITASTQFYANLSPGNCRFRFSDGTNASGFLAIKNQWEGSSQLTGVFSYATTGNRTIQVQSVEDSGNTAACMLATDEPGNWSLEMWVRRL